MNPSVLSWETVSIANFQSSEGEEQEFCSGDFICQGFVSSPHFFPTSFFTKYNQSGCLIDFLAPVFTSNNQVLPQKRLLSLMTAKPESGSISIVIRPHSTMITAFQ